MPLTIGDTAPDFEAETSEGPISFYDWLGDSWAVRAGGVACRQRQGHRIVRRGSAGPCRLA